MRQKVLKRFTVIGLPGSGKSTFALQLGKLLDIPIHHLDGHMFLPGGKKRAKEEFLSIQKRLVDEESWIIEGCAISSLEMKFSRSDTVIYFQLPRFLCMWRAFKRFIRYKFTGEAADGCSKIFDVELLRYIWNFEKEKGAIIEALRKKYPDADFHVFKSSKDADVFLKIWEHEFFF